MSVDRFKLTEDHVKLVRQLNIVNTNGKPQIDIENLFGGELYEDIDLILNGKTKDVGPTDYSDIDPYTNEQKEEWKKLINEIPTALEIILCVGSFEPGEYVKRSFNKFWFKPR